LLIAGQYYPSTPTAEPVIPYFSERGSESSNHPHHPRSQQTTDPQLAYGNNNNPETFIDPPSLDNEHPSGAPRSYFAAQSLRANLTNPSATHSTASPLEDLYSRPFNATPAQFRTMCFDESPKPWVPPNNEFLEGFFTNMNLYHLGSPISRAQDPGGVLYPSVTKDGRVLFATLKWLRSQITQVPTTSGLVVQCATPKYGLDGMFRGDWGFTWADAFSDPRLVRPYDFSFPPVAPRGRGRPRGSKNKATKARSEKFKAAVPQPKVTPLGSSSPYQSSSPLPSQFLAGDVSEAESSKSSTIMQPFKKQKVQKRFVQAVQQQEERHHLDIAAKTLQEIAKAALQLMESNDKSAAVSEGACKGEQERPSDALRPGDHPTSFGATWNSDDAAEFALRKVAVPSSRRGSRRH
jgi:hypothetical protein